MSHRSRAVSTSGYPAVLKQIVASKVINWDKSVGENGQSGEEWATGSATANVVKPCVESSPAATWCMARTGGTEISPVH